ncbi:hypothetical protein GV64_15245 [Endozoicomonas elysicola]|uniref:Uncharacterized protein n=1 Tax=Endozoicomonas elysicola TaxID=305900 RepID=A0A081KCN2_9GAMM|nr:hypothetical protein GV64_15245 [Endozoicomonas elysicola]
MAILSQKYCSLYRLHSTALNAKEYCLFGYGGKWTVMITALPGTLFVESCFADLIVFFILFFAVWL